MSSEKEVYRGKFLNVFERVIDNDVYEIAKLRSAVIIFAKNSEGKLLFVKEYRPHEEPKIRLKPVTGFIDDGDEWLETAHRELREEAGLVAKDIKLIRHIPVSGSVQTDKYFVLATQLSKDPQPLANPDGDVIKEIMYLDIKEAINLSVSGEMTLTFDSLGLFLIKELGL